MRQLIRIAAALLPLVALPACNTFTIAPGARPEVVYAEYAAENAVGAFDAFLKWERNNEAVLKEASPQIHATANEIRRSGKQWIKELRYATKVYKESSTPENRSKLQLAQQLIDLAVAEIRARTLEGKQ